MPTRVRTQRYKGIDALIEARGICPAQWEMGRLLDNIELLEAYEAHIKGDTVHPDFASASPEKFRAIVGNLRRDLMLDVRSWREFRVAKKRAVEATHDVSEGTLTLLDLLKNESGTSKGE